MSIHVGLLGLGRAGQRAAAALTRLPNAELCAYADLDPEQLRRFAALSDARAYADLSRMLEGEPDLDAVILATPAQDRRDEIDEICDRELALFCEIPPALDVATASRAARAIRRAGVIDAVALQYRASLCAGALRELIRQRPRLFAQVTVAAPLFEWARQGYLSPSLYSRAASGGPLLEPGIHYLDALRYVTRDEVVSVQGMGEPGHWGHAADRDVEETAALLFRHASGMLTTYVQNASHRGSIAEVRIVGDSFDLTWSLAGEERLSGHVDDRPIEERSPIDPFEVELRGFLEAITRRDPSLVRAPYADACRSLALCEAALSAITSGRAVEVPEPRLG